MSVIFLVLFFSLFRTLVQQSHDSFRQEIEKTAQMAAGYVTGEEVLNVPLTGDCVNDPRYQALVATLKKVMRIDRRIADVYVLVPGSREKFFNFVANADRERSPVGCGESYDATAFPELANALSRPGVDPKPTTDKWGRWISAYAPVVTAEGKSVAVLGIDIAETTYREVGRQIALHFGLAILLAMALAIIIGFASSRWLTHPIDKIIDGMERVRKGDLNYSLERLPQIEFDRIATIFNAMTVSLKTIMAQLAITVKETERLNRELELAAELQKSALPPIPASHQEVDIAADSHPAKTVGGDYFDFMLGESGKIGFVIADAAGKGFPGSLFMTNSRSVFRVISTQENGPSNILKKTNDFISAEASAIDGMFITFLYSVYEKDTKRLTYSNAGHYPPLAYTPRLKKFKTLSVGGMPLGVYPNQEFPQETVQLESEDVVVMYTDGVIEACNKEGQMFGQSRLMALIEQHAGEKASLMMNAIEADIRKFIGSEPLFDDMTLVIFKVK